jgi:hypothetical protein
MNLVRPTKNILNIYSVWLFNDAASTGEIVWRKIICMDDHESGYESDT